MTPRQTDELTGKLRDAIQELRGRPEPSQAEAAVSLA
jgi:hypothetical protein